VEAASSIKQKHSAVYAVLAVAFFGALVAGAAFIYADSQNQSIVATPLIGDRVLVNGTITVNTGFYYIEFTIPKEAYQISVEGKFSLENQTINIYVMNQTTFENWRWGVDKPDLKPDYISGQNMAGTLDVALDSSGTYYLIYDNAYQPNARIVNTEVLLHYLSS
jgi:hypothetical protein